MMINAGWANNCGIELFTLGWVRCDGVGGAGSLQRRPGGFKIGFLEDKIRFVSPFDEARFEVEPIDVREISGDFLAEIERARSAIEILDENIQLIDGSRGTELLIAETARMLRMRDQLEDSIRKLEIVRKRRIDEEELVLILTAID